MTELIVLVEDAADVGVAAAAGLRRVAVMCRREEDLPGLAAIGGAAAGRCAVSLWWQMASDPRPAVSAGGANEIWRARSEPATDLVPAWTVVAPGALGEAPESSAGLVLADFPARSRLLEAVAIDRLEAQIRDARARGLAIRLYGAMEMPDVPRLAALAPDALVAHDLPRTQGGLHRDKMRVALDLLAARLPMPSRAGPLVEPAGPDRIFVRDWTVSLHVGAYAHEHAPQRVRFSVEAELAPGAGRVADMRDVVTYDLITDAIARATVTHVDLVETVAEAVAAMVLAHPRVTTVDITVEKLDLGPGSLGCRIRRRRAPD